MTFERAQIEKQNRVLLHALQIAHPVLHNGIKQFIHTITYQSAGGGIETIVYLTGRPDAVPPHELTIDTSHDVKGAIHTSEPEPEETQPLTTEGESQ